MTTISGSYTPSDLVDAIANRKNYEVTDTATNISDSGNWAAIFSANSPVTKLTVAGVNPPLTVSSDQYKTAVQNKPQLMAGLLKTSAVVNGATVVSDFSNLVVQNVDATTFTKANQDKHVAKMTISMTGAGLTAAIKGVMTSNKIEAGGITVTDTAPGAVSLTYSQFMEFGGNTNGTLQSGSALEKFAGTGAIFSITGATIQQADTLKTGARIAKISVADTGANIAAGLSGLNSLAKLSEIKQTDSLVPLELSAAIYGTAAAAGTMAKLAKNIKLSINATAAGTDVGALANALSANGNSFGKLKVATGSTSSLTYEQYKNVRIIMSDATGKGRNFKVDVSGVSVDQSTSLLSDTSVNKIAVTANSSNFSSAANADKLFTVLSSAKVDAGSVTNSSGTTPISLSFTQFTQARWGGSATDGSIASGTTALLNKFAAGVSFNVTGASVNQADLIKGGTSIAKVSITDTAANIGSDANITKIAGLLTAGTTPANKLASIKQSDTAAIAMTATAYLANKDTLAALGASSKLSITTTADKLDDVIAQAITEKDTLTRITLSDTATATLTAAQYQKYGNLIYTAAGQQNFKTDITNATAQQASGLLTDSRIEKIDISEVKASLLNSQNTKNILGLLDNAKTRSIAFTGTGSTPDIAVSVDDFSRLGGVAAGTVDATRSGVATALSKLDTAVKFSITGATVDQAKAFDVTGSRIAKMAVNDTGSNIGSKITDLTALAAKLVSVQQKDRATAPVSLNFADYTTAAAAGTMAKLSNASKLSITAAAADISGTSGLLKLAGDANNNILKITLSNSDVAPVSLTYDQYKTLGDRIFDKTGITQNYTTNVTATTFAQAKDLLNDSRVAKVAVANSIANAVGADASLMSELAGNNKVELTLTAASNNDVQNNLAKLDALGTSLKAITSASVATDANPLSMTYAQLGNYSPTLAKINSGSFKVSLSGEQSLAGADAILGAEASTLDGHVKQLAIKTGQTSIQDSLDTLMDYAGAGKLTKIVDSAGNNVSLAVTAAQYNDSDFAALKTALTAGLATGKTLSFSVSGVGAAAAKTVGDDSNVTTLNVSDNAANIAANLAKLAGAGSKLGTITQSDAATVAPALAMSDYERQNTYATVLGKINTANSAYTMSVTNVRASDAATVAAVSHVGGVVIADTSSAIATNITGIAGLGASKLLSVGNSLDSSAINSNSALTSGTISGTAAIASGDLYINGENIGALGAAASVSARLTALETAINAKTGTTGVTATQDAATSSYRLTVADGRAITVTSNNTALQTSVSGFAVQNAVAGVGGTSVTSLAATAAGDLKINGTNIDGVGTATSVANRLSDLVGAINAKTATTGVAAAINSANGYQLTSADGRAITVTSTNTEIQTAVSGFAVKSGTSVTSGAIELTAAQYKTNILTPAAAPTSSTVAYAYTGGGMTINGSTIAAAANDNSSYVGGVKTADTGKTSAKAMAAAINLVGATSVTASASTAVKSGVISTNAAMAAGDLYINGQDIGALAAASTPAARVTQLVDAINTKTGATGITAAANNDATYTLTAADGRNIDITSNNAALQTSVSGFAVEDAANGAGGTAKTYYGKLALTSANSFTIAGDVTGSGLAAATYHDKSTEGSTVATGFNPGLIGKLDNLTLTAVSAEDAEALKNKDNINNFKVNESPANLYANGYNLANNTKVAAGDITITGTNPIFSMPFASYYGTSDIVPLFAKVSPDSRYQVVLNDMSAADATNTAKPFKTDPHVATISVSDTESNVLTNLAALKALGDTLSTLKISGTATPNLTLTESQYSSNTTLLAKINGLRLQVTGVSAANAGTIAANASVVGLTVSDTGDNIETQFANLNSLAGSASTSGVAANGATYAAGESRINVAGKLTAITRTDSAPIDITATTYANGSTALEVLLAAKTINVKDLSVDEAVDITTDDPTSGSEVAWNATATSPDTNDVYDQKVLVSVKAAAADIEADLAAGTSKLQAIDALSQLGSVQASSGKVNISGADFLADTYSSLLPNMIDGITVSDVTLDGLAPGGPDPLSSPYVSSFTFKDTGTNLVLALDKLAPGTNHTLSSKVTGIVASDGSTIPVPITLTQVNDYRATLAMVKDETGANASLNVSV